MSNPTKLGGFKILKDMAGFSLILPIGSENPVVKFCWSLTERKINLPYFTLIKNRQTWGLNSTVASNEGLRVSLIIDENFGQSFQQISDITILSVFPHKKNPEIAGRLFEVFEEKNISPFSIANSPSAISIVLQEALLNKTSQALFEPFSFSSYRSPADWKLAHKGKEELHKEVIASYQEKRPKVYGIELYDGQKMFLINLKRFRFGRLGKALKQFVGLDPGLSFMATGPMSEGVDALAMCLPGSSDDSNMEPLKEFISNSHLIDNTAVAVFSMNGPHFGERYGIISELLRRFEKSGIDLLGLSCTVASITGVVQSAQIEQAIEAVKQYFDVPAVIKKS
jgi:aspartokinase